MRRNVSVAPCSGRPNELPAAVSDDVTIPCMHRLRRDIVGCLDVVECIAESTQTPDSSVISQSIPWRITILHVVDSFVSLSDDTVTMNAIAIMIITMK